MIFINATFWERTQRKAQEYHDQLKVSPWRESQLGERPRRKWEDAVERWFEKKREKATLDDDRNHLRWLHNTHPVDRYLDEISKELVDSIHHARKREGALNATVNRTLEVLRGILRMAADLEWLDSVPKSIMLREPSKRVRWLKPDEADRLVAELPEHLAEMARFTLATGLRESNVTGLEWSQVDMSRRCAWIHADQAKARKAITVPLNEEAVAVLERQMGKHPARVFPYRGNRTRKANTKAWRKALVRAGIQDFRWHDPRHTWASWHVQVGTPLPVLQELGGWQSYEMVLRYAHLAPGHLAEYADRLSITAQFPAQSEREEPEEC